MTILRPAGLALLCTAVLAGCAPRAAPAPTDPAWPPSPDDVLPLAPAPLGPEAAVPLAELRPAVSCPSTPPASAPQDESAAESLDEAQALQGRGEHAAALAALEKAHQQHPHSLAVRRRLALAYAARGAWNKARPLLEALADQAGNDVAVQHLRGQLALAEGRLDEAILHHRTALACADADDAAIATNECLFHLGAILLRRGCLTAALDCYTRLEENLQRHGQALARSGELAALANQPELLLCRQGRVLLRLGRSAEAAQCGDLAYRMNKTYAPAMQLLVEALAADRQIERAQVTLLELIHGPAPVAQVRAVIVWFFRAENDPQGPWRLWEDYQAGTPAPPDGPVRMLAQASWELGGRAQAIDILRRYRRVRGDQAQASAQLAQYLLAEGNVAEALTVLAAMLEQDPDADELVDRRIADVPAARVGEAMVRQWAVAVADDASPRRFALHYVGALLAGRAHLRQLAEEQFIAALEARGDFVPAHRALVGLYLRQGLHDRAMAQAEAAGERTGQAFIGHYLTGMVLLQQGRTDQAVGRLQQAVDLQPDHVPSRRLLAQAQFRARRVEDAQRHLLYAFREMRDLAAGEALVRMYFDLAGAARGPEAARLRTTMLLRARQVVEAMTRMDAEDPVALRMQATFQHAAGRHLRARQTLQRLIAVAGEETEVRLLKVVLESRTSLSPEGLVGPLRLARARQDLLMVLERQADHPEALTLLARLYLAKGRYAESASLLGKLRQARPSELPVALLHALALSRAGQAAAAAEALEPFADELAGDQRLWAWAVLLGDAGRHDQAVALLQGRIEKASTPSAQLADRQILASVLARAGRTAEARALVDRMGDPNSPESLEAAAIARLDVLAQAGRFRELQTAAATWLDQTDAAQWARRAAGTPREHLNHRWAMEQAGLRGRSDARPWRLLASSGTPLDLAIGYLIQAGRVGQAERFALRQIDRLSDRGDDHAALAAATRADLVLRLHLAGQRARARRRFDRFLKDDPNNHELLLLAQTLLDGSDPDQQRRLLALMEQARAQTPDDAALLNNLGYHLADAGIRLGEAEVMLRQALAAQPTANTRDSLGWLKYKQGQFAAALEYLLLALNDDDGDSAVVYDHVGDAFWRLGRRRQAVAMWSEAADLASAALEAYGELTDADTRRAADQAARKLRAARGALAPPLAPLGQGVRSAEPPADEETEPILAEPDGPAI